MLCVTSAMAADRYGCYNVNGEPLITIKVEVNNPVSKKAKVGDVLGTLTYVGGTYICKNTTSWAPEINLLFPSSGGVRCGFPDFPTLKFKIFSLDGRSPACNISTYLTRSSNPKNKEFVIPPVLLAQITVGPTGLKPPAPGESYHMDFSRVIADAGGGNRLTLTVEGDPTLYFSAPGPTPGPDPDPSYPMQIYFPASPLAPPAVDLGLVQGPDKTSSGTRQLDMCLYDGLNSTSKLISLTFQDEGAGAPGRRPGMFSVYRQGANKLKEADRLDYELSVINPGTGGAEAVTEGKEFFWAGMNNRRIQRQVVLPGIPGLSYCVPAPLTLRTPAFKLNGKNAGHYTGLLKVIYRIPTFG